MSVDGSGVSEGVDTEGVPRGVLGVSRLVMGDRKDVQFFL